MTTKTSFWLIPSEEYRVFFQEIIDTLAQEYDAPAFVPHVTVYSGEYEPDQSPSEMIEEATQGVQSFSLRVQKLLYTDQLAKTLFVQFQPCAILSKISETLRSSSSQPSDYVLNPHLSLIYQKLSEATQKKIVNSLSLPKSEVFFNEVSAISSPKFVPFMEEVKNCKVIWTKKL